MCDKGHYSCTLYTHCISTQQFTDFSLCSVLLVSLIYFIAGYPRLPSATSNTSIPQTFRVFMPTSML